MGKSYTKEERQDAIDEAWTLYQAAMESCEELEGALHDLQIDYGINTVRANDAAAEALTALTNAYEASPPILPPDSSELDEED